MCGQHKGVAAVAWWRSGLGVGLATERTQVRVPAAPLHVTTLGKLFTHNVPILTNQYKLVPAIGWEGNRRSGVALRHWPCVTDSVVYPPYGLNGLGKGDEMPKLHSEHYGIFTFT